MKYKRAKGNLADKGKGNRTPSCARGILLFSFLSFVFQEPKPWQRNQRPSPTQSYPLTVPAFSLNPDLSKKKIVRCEVFLYIVVAWHSEQQQLEALIDGVSSSRRRLSALMDALTNREMIIREFSRANTCSVWTLVCPSL